MISLQESLYAAQRVMIEAAMWGEIDHLESAISDQWYGLSEFGKAVALLLVVVVLFMLTRNAKSNAVIALSALTGLVVIAYFIIFFMAHY